MVHVLPKVQSKWNIITDLFLEEGIIHFFLVSEVTDFPINFDLLICIANNK